MNIERSKLKSEVGIIDKIYRSLLNLVEKFKVAFGSTVPNMRTILHMRTGEALVKSKLPKYHRITTVKVLLPSKAAVNIES